jgi:hypothetical protein
MGRHKKEVKKEGSEKGVIKDEAYFEKLETEKSKNK